MASATDRKPELTLLRQASAEDLLALFERISGRKATTITGIAGCCALAGSGHASVAPPSSVMKWRRRITRSPRPCERASYSADRCRLPARPSY